MGNFLLRRAAGLIRVVTFAAAVCAATTPVLACVVGTGTSASCTESALNACLPGTVTFNCGAAPVTIMLTTTKTIGSDTTIDGGGTITLQNKVDAFSVNTGVSLTLQNLTLSGSSGLEAIICNGTATVTATNCTFGGNDYGIDCTNGAVTTTNCAFAAGLYGINTLNGPVTATNCTFSGNGNDYGINTLGGAVTATGCSFTGDQYGINTEAAVTATRCTFTGDDYGINTEAAVTATGCSFTGYQYGINTFEAVTAANCTFAGGQYGINTDGAVTATNCTFSSNDYGINAGSTITLANTILANSSQQNCSGPVQDNGHNIDDGSTCNLTGMGCSSTTGTSFCNTNPGLDPAGAKNNGGSTQTIALCTASGTPPGCSGASPAINAGDNTTCSNPPVSGVDQRGFSRFPTGDPVCDIGAFEAQPSTSAPSPAPALSPAGLMALGLALVVMGCGATRRRRSV